MPEQQEQTIVALLGTLSNQINTVGQQVSQIDKNLAINTTKTGYIEEHLRTLNGKVIKQEERLQVVEKSSEALTTTRRRWYDGFSGFAKFIVGVASTLISAYIINKYF